jgi:hypothetical protein
MRLHSLAVLASIPLACAALWLTVAVADAQQVNVPGVPAPHAPAVVSQAVQVAKPTISQVAKPAVTEPPMPAASQAPKPVVSPVAKPVVSQVAKPVVRQVAKPAVSQAPMPAASQAAKPATSQIATTTAEHPAAQAATQAALPAVTQAAQTGRSAASASAQVSTSAASSAQHAVSRPPVSTAQQAAATVTNPLTSLSSAVAAPAEPQAPESVAEPVESVTELAVEPVESVTELAVEPVQSVTELAVEPVGSVTELAVTPVESVTELAIEPVLSVADSIVATVTPVEGLSGQPTDYPVLAPLPLVRLVESPPAANVAPGSAAGQTLVPASDEAIFAEVDVANVDATTGPMLDAVERSAIHASPRRELRPADNRLADQAPEQRPDSSPIVDLTAEPMAPAEFDTLLSHPEQWTRLFATQSLVLDQPIAAPSRFRVNPTRSDATLPRSAAPLAANIERARLKPAQGTPSPFDPAQPLSPLMDGATPAPATAPGGISQSGGGAQGGASPLLATLSLTTAWRPMWRLGDVRPTGIVLPSLAPPG